jgi:Carboxypeptidase regulatory-like domain/TonB dependent receptor
MRILFRSLFLGLSLLCLLSHVQAQASESRFSVSGVVRDQNGALIVGAQVELLRADATRRTVSTGDTGGFTFNRVLPGDYKLRVSAEGFEPANIALKVGPQAPQALEVMLSVANVRLQSNITAESERVGIESDDNQNAITIRGDALSNLPIFDQDFVSALSRFLDPADVGTGGVTLIVNGVEAASVAVSSSAVKEIRINQDPYSAEFARPGRGRISILTKPGNPSYHGTFNFTFRDAHFNARDPFAMMRPPEQRRIYEGILTGPIRHSKKTAFLLSVNRSEEDLQAVVFARGPAVIIRENVPDPTRNFLIAGQIDHTVNDKSSFSIRYSFHDQSARNQGAGGTTLPEAATDSRFFEHEVNISHQSILSPNLINQFQLTLGHFSSPVVSVTQSPKIVVLDAFTGGGAQADQLFTEYHFVLADTLSYSTGRHLIKTGINVPDWSRRGSDRNTNLGGTFYFSSLADFEQGRPYSFTQQQGSTHLVFLEKVLGGFVQDEYHLRPNLLVSAGLRYDWQNYFHDNNNFSPRLSFAYSPDKNQRTVIRGGVGVFYDRTGPGPILDTLYFNGSTLRLYVLENPGFPNPLGTGGSLAAQPVSVTRLDPNVHIPYQLQYSFGVERQVRKTTTVGVAYVGARGIGLFRSRDINAPPPPDYTARPDLAVGVLREIESAGRSRRDSLEVSLRGNVTHYFIGMAQYRLARNYNDTSGINYLPPNTYDLAGEWSRSDEDRRHRFDLLGTFTPTKLFNLGVSLSLYSGTPYTMTTGRDDFHTGTANARPVGISRNSLQGPGYADLDLRWSRDFLLERGKKDKSPAITVALDAFNVMNHVNFISFVGNLSSPFFGQAVAAQPPRRLQLSARFKF